MTKNRICTYAFFLFFIDIIIASELKHYLVYSLLTFYAYILFVPIKHKALTFIMLLLCFEQFIIFDHFGLPLLYLVPITIFSHKGRSLFYSYHLLPLAIILVCLTSQLIFIEPFLLGIFEEKHYTMGKFFGNMLLTGLFTLKFKSAKS